MPVKNILFINSSSVVFGAETRLLDIIRHVKEGYRPFVLLPHPGPLADLLKSLGIDTTIMDFKFQVTGSNPVKFFQLNRDFMKLVRNKKIDLIHVNLHYKTSNFFLAFLLLRKPVIYHLRSHHWIHIFEKLVMSHCHKVICVSQAVKNNLLQKRRSDIFSGAKADRVEVLYDGIDTKTFRPQPRSNRLREKYHIAANDKIVCLAGAIMPIKGQDILINAAPDILKKHPNTIFLLSGSSMNQEGPNPFYETMKDLIQRLGLSERVIWTGYLKDTVDLMNEIDILVQPSEREALGTSMVEAMACERPVVGTNIDGIPEVIGDNESGLLLKKRIPEELAASVNFLLSHPEETRKKGIAGRQRVMKMFDVYTNIRRIEQIYDEALLAKTERS